MRINYSALKATTIINTSRCSKDFRSFLLAFYSNGVLAHCLVALQVKKGVKPAIRGNGGNQFRQYAGQNVGNPAGYNDVIGNQVIQNAVQNPRVQNIGNQNGLIGVQGNGNQNQIGNGNLVAAHAEGNTAGQNVLY
uniref:Uncharacterized protein n=1 Tax=Tanacetum cinerariifolium TaxID=118510 RepID=A0A6L2MJB0_TANCI|nr:hypothetical protein [Tanacetum cinerariifolium]